MSGTLLRPSEAVEKGLKLPFDRLYMRVPGEMSPDVGRLSAETALRHAQARAPRLSGASGGRLQPIWGKDFFGIRWLDNYVWFQEMGISAFTMNSLQGKTIPMWVEDTDGKLARDNPKIKKRTAADGRSLVLIFRHASKKGQRKMVKRNMGGIEMYVSVPRSYPGAPGRIAKRHPGAPLSRGGVGGQIAKGNVGVRWRHPGLTSRFFLHESLILAAREIGLPQGVIGVAPMGVSI